MMQVGEKLGKAEVEKRRAIENEDYDKAKVKKQQMDEYRHLAYENLHISQLLDSSVVWHNFSCYFCIIICYSQKMAVFQM